MAVPQTAHVSYIGRRSIHNPLTYNTSVHIPKMAVRLLVRSVIISCSTLLACAHTTPQLPCLLFNSGLSTAITSRRITTLLLDLTTCAALLSKVFRHEGCPALLCFLALSSPKWLYINADPSNKPTHCVSVNKDTSTSNSAQAPIPERQSSQEHAGPHH